MTPVLQHLELVACRGIRGLRLDDLAPISLIVGANNSGKSTLLEAASLLLRPADPLQWLRTMRQRDLDMPVVDGLWSFFPGGALPNPEEGPQRSAPLALAGRVSGLDRRVEAVAEVVTTVGATEGVGLGARIEVAVDGAPPLTLRFPEPPAVGHQVAQFRVFLASPGNHYSMKSQVEHLSQVVSEGSQAVVIELLRLYDPAVEAIDVIDTLGRELVVVTHAQRGVVDLSSFGDGMRRAVALALALARTQQGVLLIDELELGIHPQMLGPVVEHLVAAARVSGTQIIATTHSLEAVDAVIRATADGGLDQLATWWLRRKDERHEAQRYDARTLRVVREGGLDIR